MQHHGLQRERRKRADTSDHNADIFHRGISQNTLHVTLHNYKGHSNRHGQHCKEQQHAAHHRYAGRRQQNHQITQQHVNCTAAQRTAEHAARQRRSLSVGIRQPGVHRRHACLRAVTDNDEQQRQLGHSGVQAAGMLIKIQPAQGLVAAQSIELCIIENQRSQKRQTDTDGADHDIFPCCFQSRARKFKGDEQRTDKRSRLNRNPHQAEVFHQQHDEHRPAEKLHERKITARLQLLALEHAAALLTRQIAARRPGCRQIQRSDDDNHPHIQRIDVKIIINIGTRRIEAAR